MKYICADCRLTFYEAVAKKVYDGDRMQPPEYEAICPHCGSECFGDYECDLCRSAGDEDENPLEEIAGKLLCPHCYAENVKAGE